MQSDGYHVFRQESREFPEPESSMIQSRSRPYEPRSEHSVVVLLRVLSME
jgi:hypothetical protein